jgi:hypothetical protein
VGDVESWVLDGASVVNKQPPIFNLQYVKDVAKLLMMWVYVSAV